MHTKDKLAEALAVIDAPEAMVQRARDGFYHDFLSPLEMPAIKLAEDLADLAKDGNEGAAALRQRHLNGEFDASLEESEEWMNGPEGQAAMKALVRGR